MEVAAGRRRRDASEEVVARAPQVMVGDAGPEVADSPAAEGLPLRGCRSVGSASRRALPTFPDPATWVAPRRLASIGHREESVKRPRAQPLRASSWGCAALRAGMGFWSWVCVGHPDPGHGDLRRYQI